MAEDDLHSGISHHQIEATGILRYRAEELLALQDVCGAYQTDWWTQLLTELGPEITEGLHEMQAVPDASHVRRRSKNRERRQRSKAKREALHAISSNALESVEGGDIDTEYCNALEGKSASSCQGVNENTGGRSHFGKQPWKHRQYYDEDSEEVESFQPPAFAVEGEPDFESGSPQDGWEYLRRVKYEAARCPKVVVAKIDPAKLATEQTQYMPEIPDIPNCPSELLPSKEWEKELLLNFSLLRKALSKVRISKTGSNCVPSVRNKAAWEIRCFGSITSTSHEDSKEPDVVTTQTAPQATENRPEAKELSLTFHQELPSTSSCMTVEHSLEADNVEDNKAPSSKLSKELGHLDTGSVEANYVIDLGLVCARIPNNMQLEGLSESCHETMIETEFLSAKEPAQVHGNFGVMKVCEEDPQLVSGWSFDSADYSSQDLGHVDNLFSTELEPQTNEEPMGAHSCNDYSHNVVIASSSPILSPVQLNDEVTTACLMHSVDVSATTLHMHFQESSSGFGVQFEHQPTMEFEDKEHDIVDRTLCSEFELMELEDNQPGDTLTLEAQSLDPLDELHTRVENQSEFLSVAEPAGDIDVTDSPYFYPDVVEAEDVELTTRNFIGLEIYHSGNLLHSDEDELFDESGESNLFEIDESLDEIFTKVFQSVGVCKLPFISLLLRLDEVSRAALFRHHVSWLENIDGLPQDRAMWLLALSAVVDTPLNAETSAAFRSMLRHCAGIRALKQAGDDDVYMLNVLITVAGLYFGQAEASLS